jgi:hypothetical protein
VVGRLIQLLARVVRDEAVLVGHRDIDASALAQEWNEGIEEGARVGHMLEYLKGEHVVEALAPHLVEPLEARDAV